ncbi:MAG: NAD(+) synthase, partial [Clostridia bacterium]|nr:NAD(+) synthase [Clostridia bacterium]
MNYGFVRTAAVTPKMRVADVEYNVQQIIQKIDECAARGVQLAVFPELCISGYTCADLFFQSTLVNACLNGLKEIVTATKQSKILSFIGLPLEYNGKLYNVAAAVSGGKVLAFIPKQNLPNYGEFNEVRYFAQPTADGVIELNFDSQTAQKVYFGNHVILQAENFPEFSVGCEICEDMWSLHAPSAHLAQAGANIIVNLSASDEIVGKSNSRILLVNATSSRCVCGYVYATS